MSKVFEGFFEYNTSRIYSLRIIPPKPVFDKIVGVKSETIQIYGAQQLSRSIPHVTVATFEMYPEYQGLLLKALHPLANIGKFRLNVNGFDVFDKHVYLFYLKIGQSVEINNLITLLKIIWVRDLHRKKKSLKVTSTPHITIFKTKDKNILYRGLNLFNQQNYFQQFEVNQLILASRLPGKTWDWTHKIYLDD